MDASVNTAVSASISMQQAQTAQQAQMQIFRDALDIQKHQVTALLESAMAGSGSESGSNLASEGHLGTRVNTFA
jgi:hypothetical protein